MILFEDEHILAANKPPGLNTHAPSPFAGQGLYEWLRDSLPGRARLAIIHRLDKETSGVIVFGKNPAANRSLTRQFEDRAVRKKYLLLTDRKTSFARLTVKSRLARAGDKYLARPAGAGGAEAVTRFTLAGSQPPAAGGREGCFVWEAEPLTGRTHQIRAQAAAHGFPILGDTLYGGAPAGRVFLHAAQLGLRHPASGEELVFDAPPDFSADPRWTLRAAVIAPSATDAFRLTHGAADGWPGLQVDRLGDFLLAQSAEELTAAQRAWVEELLRRFCLRGAYHKLLRRRADNRRETSPQWLCGQLAPAEILARENGLRFALRFEEGGSVGLFLDQRENRRRLLTGYIAPDFTLPRPFEALNAFSHTCAFSVCAAAGGARVASLDLSKHYLEWGRRNFALNGLDPAAHDFMFGDAFAWFRRMARRGRLFDVIILDPPTFSRSKEHGVFQVESDTPALVGAALPLLRRGGVLLASTNAATLPAQQFLDKVALGAARAGRPVTRRHYAPQPPDFPLHRAEPAHLKTVWLRVG
ncbi:MAG: pseudouridine synthase [Verrucomicrobiota bacterium]